MRSLVLLAAVATEAVGAMGGGGQWGDVEVNGLGWVVSGGTGTRRPSEPWVATAGGAWRLLGLGSRRPART